MKIKVFAISALVVILGVIGILAWRPLAVINFEKTDYENMDLDGFDKLMVIAHPDDDVLWGGSELIHEDYLVVCITCGSDYRRVREFETVMERTHDKYVMLGYPDKTKGEKDNWDTVRDDIKSDIEKIYALKDWEKIITHNPEGEYGHIHHKMTDKIVTDTVNHENLFYFGKYYSKRELEENEEMELPLLDEDTLKEKEEILNLYVTQDYTIHKTFGHMIKSENVVSYEEWNKLYEKEEQEDKK